LDRQALRRADVEAFLHQLVDHVHREPGMHRIIARRVVLEEPLPVLHVPVRIVLAIILVLLVAVANGVAVVDREGRAAVLLIALVLVVADYDQHVELGAGERLGDVPDAGTGDVLALDQMLRRHHVGKLGIGLLEQVAVSDGATFLVTVLNVAVGLDEALQRLVGGEQHGRVGCSEPEHDLGHRCSFCSVRWTHSASS
jgi:hypothetical protein